MVVTDRGDRNSPHRYVCRAPIILATEDGSGTGEVGGHAGAVRFMIDGVDGLRATRPGRHAASPEPPPSMAEEDALFSRFDKQAKSLWLSVDRAFYTLRKFETSG